MDREFDRPALSIPPAGCLGPGESGGTGQPVRVLEVPSSLMERTHVMSAELNAYLFFPDNTEPAIAF